MKKQIGLITFTFIFIHSFFQTESPPRSLLSPYTSYLYARTTLPSSFTLSFPHPYSVSSLHLFSSAANLLQQPSTIQIQGVRADGGKEWLAMKSHSWLWEHEYEELIFPFESTVLSSLTVFIFGRHVIFLTIYYHHYYYQLLFLQTPLLKAMMFIISAGLQPRPHLLYSVQLLKSPFQPPTAEPVLQNPLRTQPRMATVSIVVVCFLSTTVLCINTRTGNWQQKTTPFRKFLLTSTYSSGLYMQLPMYMARWQGFLLLRIQHKSSPRWLTGKQWYLQLTTFLHMYGIGIHSFIHSFIHSLTHVLNGLWTHRCRQNHHFCIVFKLPLYLPM